VKGGGRGGDDAKNSEKGTPADRAEKAARRALRRDAERTAVRNVAHAGRAGQADALPAGKHFRAVAALAQAGVRRIRGGEKAARRGQVLARRRLRNDLGVSAQARDSQEICGSALAERQKATFSATGSSLKCEWIGAEER